MKKTYLYIFLTIFCGCISIAQTTVNLEGNVNIKDDPATSEVEGTLTVGNGIKTNSISSISGVLKMPRINMTGPTSIVMTYPADSWNSIVTTSIGAHLIIGSQNSTYVESSIILGDRNVCYQGAILAGYNNYADFYSYKAVLKLPICIYPVGLGAKRVLTFIFRFSK